MRWLLKTFLFSLVFPWHQAQGKRALCLEIAALRHQLGLYERTRPKPRFGPWDRRLWIWLSRTWPGWRSACVVIQPATVIRWHRSGYRWFWRWKSRLKGGRPKASAEDIALVRRLAKENPTWGAPRIHGELQLLGFRLAERTVQRYLPKRPKPAHQGPSWKTFLATHREALAAVDFMTVPTWRFERLHVLVILDHARRHVRHVAVTAHPTLEWLRAQLREAFPGDETWPTRLLHDRDALFQHLPALLAALGLKSHRIGYRCPWQNGAVERFNGTLRRELLNHVIVKDEAHLRRLLRDFVRYYHEDRTHLGLAKSTPDHRPSQPRPGPTATVVEAPRVGGLHHRYTWHDVA